MQPRQSTETKTERTMLIRAVVAATLENGGAAVKFDTHEFLPAMDIWSFPKYPGKTVILPADFDLEAGLRDFIDKNEQFLKEPDCWLGTWIHPQTREFYLDISTGSIDLEESMKKAREAGDRDARQIVAIYNPKRKQTIFL